MPKQRLSGEEKVYAGREDELHEPSGKTKRLTTNTNTQTAQDTDNPERESLHSAPRREHLHPVRPKNPPLRAPAAENESSFPHFSS